MEREVNQINVIPLVDVMLVLLVIVLTTATFISTGQIPVNLAKPRRPGIIKDVPVVVTLTANGDLFLNDRPVPADGLKSMLLVHPKGIPGCRARGQSHPARTFLSRLSTKSVAWGFQSVSLEVVRL